MRQVLAALLLPLIGSADDTDSSNPRDLYAYYPSTAGPHVHVRHNVGVTRVAATPIRLAESVRPAAPLCVTGGCPIHVPAPVVVDRVEVQHVVRELTCPNGMVLEGRSCVGEDLCPATFVCPAGTVAAGGASSNSCVATARALAECPVGYTLDGSGQCTLCELTPAELICDEPGSVLEGNMCVKMIAPPPHCPPGFHMEGSRCVSRAPVSLTCPTGYTLHGQTCQRTQFEEAQMVCPDGSSLENGRCIVLKQDPPHCPPGFHYSSDFGNGYNRASCVQTVQRHRAPCPAGMTRVGDACERAENYPATPGCPSDYVLEGSMCIRSIPQPPKCPPGYNFSASRDGSCEKSIRQIPQCRPGTQMVGTGINARCEAITVHPAVDSCPPGFTLDSVRGKCVREDRLAPEMVCANSCQKTRETRVAYACPDGLEYLASAHGKAHRCRRAIHLCPAVPQAHSRCMKSIVEEIRSSVSEKTSGDSQLPASTLEDLVETVVEDATMASTKRELQHCPPKPVIMEYITRCSEDTEPAQLFCPEGGQVIDGRCVLNEPVVPERRCKIGRLDTMSGDCVREQLVPVKKECPAGTQRKAGTCLVAELSVPDMVCPSGTNDNGAGACVATVAAEQCEPMVSRIPASYSCASGGRLNGTSCVNYERSVAELVCPAEETGNGQCVRRADMITPAPVQKVVRPSFFCNDGRNLVDRTSCVVTESVQPERICSGNHNAILNHNANMCEMAVDLIRPPAQAQSSYPRTVCAAGRQLVGGVNQCSIRRTTAALLSCPAGMQLQSGGTCSRHTARTAVCPAGTTLIGNSCSRRISVAAHERVVAGCVHREVACATCPRVNICQRG